MVVMGDSLHEVSAVRFVEYEGNYLRQNRPVPELTVDWYAQSGRRVVAEF